MLALLIELPGIEDIVPHTVEAAGNAGDRREERVSHPDGKNRVLLPTCLSCTDRFAVLAPYPAAEGELDNAGHKTRQGDARLIDQWACAVNNAPGSDSYGQGQGTSPQIKG